MYIYGTVMLSPLTSQSRMAPNALSSSAIGLNLSTQTLPLLRSVVPPVTGELTSK